jgi:hypothetical protein
MALIPILMMLSITAEAGDAGAAGAAAVPGTGGSFMKDEAVIKAAESVAQSLKDEDRERFSRGARVVASLWEAADGSTQDYVEFCRKYFIPSGDQLDRVFARFESDFETVNGHMLIISREISRPIQLDMGEPLPIDYLFAEYNPAAHVLDDMFKNRIAFVALLNFPPYSLGEKLQLGEKWDRKSWAFAKLSEGFRDRIPADDLQKVSEIFTRVDNYISEYNIFMGYVTGADHLPLFPENLKLITHWGLRDELKGQYAKENPLPRQEAIYSVMKRIIDGSVPVEVINRGEYRWDPAANGLFDVKTGAPVQSKGGEGTGRYERLMQIFEGELLIDPHAPTAPTHIIRRFERDRQIPEAEVEKLLISVLESPQATETARFIAKRLGRGLRPFDIWYNGFKGGRELNEDKLDKMVRKKYPTLALFQKDIPNILKKLGFDAEDAKYLAARIEVDPARGAGHAMGAETRTDKAHLRTRVPREGMNYKGFNIAMHELGHCVEQVLTLNRMDYYSLRGIPNTAFTESYAFMFQSRDLDVLGVPRRDPLQDSLNTVNDFWMTFEIAGVSVVDMRVWRWMYEHRGFTPAQLKDAVIAIARDVWNRYYAPIMGIKDEPVLAVYSHMIDAALYLPDYPLGHLINFQIEESVKDKSLAAEMKRMLSSGSITPSAWMKASTGEPLSAAPLLKATGAALAELTKEE